MSNAELARAACPNELCEHHGRLAAGNVVLHGDCRVNGGRRRLYRCIACDTTSGTRTGRTVPREFRPLIVSDLRGRVRDRIRRRKLTRYRTSCGGAAAGPSRVRESPRTRNSLVRHQRDRLIGPAPFRSWLADRLRRHGDSPGMASPSPEAGGGGLDLCGVQCGSLRGGGR